MVPAWQILASVVIQLFCAVVAVWLAGKAFRLGMLRYGQRLRLRIAIIVAMTRLAKATGIGHHPGILFFDALGSVDDC